MTYPIVEKLLHENVLYDYGDGVTLTTARNRDGPEAAAHIEALAEALDDLVTAVGETFPDSEFTGQMLRARTALSNLREGGGQ
jgi:hypothetical protein